MKNLEIKAKYGSYNYGSAIARNIGASYKGLLRQTDIYFKVKQGRLKMRVINNKTYELIHYHRANTKRARYSNYEIIRLKEGAQMLKLLTSSVGILCKVVKERRLYIFENARIHLDKVKGLGNFIEFEIVCSSTKDEKEAPPKMRFLKKVFHVDEGKILPYSYSDMICG